MKKLIEFTEYVNHRHAHRALLDDKILKTADGFTVFYDEEEAYAFRINKGGADETFVFKDHLITHEEIETEWYENISAHGVLCWVWDEFESLKVPAFVYIYDPQDVNSFICCTDTSLVRDLNDYVFKNAAPMTASEVQKYIFAEQLTN